MDPRNAESFNHQTKRLSTGRTYHFVDQVPENYKPNVTPTLLCVHGFPDLWYGWRYQIGPWVRKYGWRVIVPDMLGYGETDKPADPKHYSLKALCDDLAALLDLVGVKKAVVLGHDWGCAIVWRLALWHPSRVQALVTLSIPFSPPHKRYISLEEVARRQPMFEYQLYFNNPSSTKEIEAKLDGFLSAIYSLGASETIMDMLKALANTTKIRDQKLNSEKVNFRATQYLYSNFIHYLIQEHAYYLENFKKGGMNGPLNYYRTTKHRYEEEAGKLPDRLSASVPVLFLWGNEDPTCASKQIKGMNKFIPNFREIMFPNIGHWILLQAPEAATTEIARFIKEVASNESKL